MDFGDFQTPREFTSKICQILKKFYLINPQILIEPTAGLGNFVFAALETFNKIDYVYCIDIQEKYKDKFTEKLQKSPFQAKNLTIEYKVGSIYDHIFSNQFFSYLTTQEKPSILIIGNPPWVTNSNLSKINSGNLPKKRNFKKIKGINTLTGKSNFDIAENIILSMIQQASQWNVICHFAFLCKDIVIRNIIYAMPTLDLPISDLYAIHFDAKRIFNINASASLFVFSLNQRGSPICNESQFNFEKQEIYNRFGWLNGKFVSNLANYLKYSYLDGNCPFTWRQGIKHDLIKVMVLQKNDLGDLINGTGEIVNVEDDFLFPFLKSSTLKSPIMLKSNLTIIVPQKSLRETTDRLLETAPRLYSYLNSHYDEFISRKSKIYKKNSPFAIFGIGDYTFSPYKIAISGFYKTPNFVLLMNDKNIPLMLDDTCYYLSFFDIKTAIFTWLLLQLSEVKEFLSSIVFIDAKRPYTKDILMRLDIIQLAQAVKFQNLLEIYSQYQDQFMSNDLTESDWLNYLSNLKSET